jgi:heat shock protein HtpX
VTLLSFYASDTIALRIAGAKAIQQQDNPYVYRLVENLAITAGIPRPKIFIINDTALNAFATGRDPQHASIALTSGIVEALKNEELEGVIAHELSHIRNFDTRLMTVAIICVGIVTLLANIMTRNMMWSGRQRSDTNSGARGIFVAIGIILGLIAPLFAKLLQLAVSRQREYLADASGALLTRYPEGLASALEKISHSQPLQHINQATAHLYISEPSGEPLSAEDGKRSGGFSNFFSTHPPIADRIKRLRTIG